MSMAPSPACVGRSDASKIVSIINMVKPWPPQTPPTFDAVEDSVVAENDSESGAISGIVPAEKFIRKVTPYISMDGRDTGRLLAGRTDPDKLLATLSPKPLL